MCGGTRAAGLSWADDACYFYNDSGVGRKNDALRARQCVQLLTELGPTFVKIGQALSIRVDLLSPEYITQLKTLQDRQWPM